MSGKSILQRIFISFVFVALTAGAAFAQGTGFNFQGRLNDGASPANGNVELQFRLYDALAEGNQIGADVTNPSVAVINGIFSTPLDFGAAAFDGLARFVEIGVRPAGSKNPFTILNPRQQVLSTPYAIQSRNAAQLGGVDAIEYVTTTTGGANFIQNAAAQQVGASFNIDGNGTAGSLDVIGAVSIRGNVPPAPAPAGQGRIYFDAATNKVRVSENNGDFIDLVGAAGVSGSGMTNSIPLWTDATTLGDSLISQSGGTTVLLPAFVSLAATASGNNVAFGSPNSGTGMTISGPSARADVRLDGATLRLAAGPAGVGPPGNGIAITSTGVQLPNGVQLGVGAQGNQVQFGSPNSETGMTISGAGGRADLRFDGTLKLVNGPGGIPSPTNGIAINTAGNVGVGTTAPVAKLHVVGTTRTSLLQVTGGSDVAENFEFADTVKAGTVVAIDSRNAGKLIVARGAYNRRVAGVISGANNLSAGLLLPDLKENSNSSPVALSGRVWVYCDATRRPVKPGDLLTTSSTPGHAMKVVNYTKAQGAIIGKAMTGLKSGTGLVLVLVTLQ